jgi:hypothetical protein
MSRLMPRLTRPDALAVVDELGQRPIVEIAAKLPLTDPPFVYSELGGMPVDRAELASLRRSVVELATEHGYPEARRRGVEFDARCGRLLHETLGITAHEAAQDEVWCGLTVGHLLDVAVWRWDRITDARRVNGDANRDTFRRLWWRVEIFGGAVSAGIGPLLEDEYVAIMERPFVTGNPRVARAIAASFLRHAGGSRGEVQRTLLLRETMKLLTRLTPFVAFDVLTDEQLARSLDQQFDHALSALAEAEPDQDDAARESANGSGATESARPAPVRRSGGVVGGVRRALGRARPGP